jgi:D-alanine-D-alanine ligase
VQGLFELAGVPYVGNGVLASALAMDKRMCQRVLAAEGIPTVPTIVVTAENRTQAASKAAAIGYPIFVKPNRAGSSVGVSRVDSADGLRVAIDLALASDTTVLMQPLVVGDEVDLGVLQDTNGDVAVGAALRILPGEGSSFFDYASKYTDGGHEFEVPARLDEDVRLRLETLAMAAFRALDCEGLARADFFVTTDGSVILNEVNTMPGMTSLSQYPAMWQAMGVTYTQLLSRLIDRALVARARTAR